MGFLKRGNVPNELPDLALHKPVDTSENAGNVMPVEAIVPASIIPVATPFSELNGVVSNVSEEHKKILRKNPKELLRPNPSL